ncbi:unnamed protein product [Gongylonema pulchrum]|uniref:MIF4G domain-containing protein n=1 Tax=Gongylonema pulchrum TaxID=637853 RepID=A0A183DN07_9BILA|nr:unnamed protein product [Gongylonema pulchrum]
MDKAAEERVRAYVQEVESRVASQLADRKAVEDSVPLSEDQLRRLDSTLKRTTAFMKKLKNIGSGHTIADAKIKYNDVKEVVSICVKLKCYYAEFSSLLLLELRKLMPVKRSDKIQNPSKLRVDIRLLTELCLHGVFAKEGLQLLGSVLSYLTITDKSDHLNLPILLPFCKVSSVDLLGLHSFPVKQDATALGTELPCSPVLTSEHKKTFAQLFLDYRASLIEHIRKDLMEVNQLLRSIKKQMRTRGDASAEDHSRLDAARARYEKILAAGVQLSEVLGVEMEKMEEEQSEDEEEEILTVAFSQAKQDGNLSIWPDKDTRYFYETKLELRQLVPSILFQESEQQTLDLVGTKIDDVDLSGLDTVVEEPENDRESLNEEDEDVTLEVVDVNPAITASIMEPKVSGQDLKTMTSEFLRRLPWLINRDLIDSAALDFVTNLNTSSNRKKLCQMMLEEHQARLDLLPFYGRLIATLEPVMPDLAIEISQTLIQQFRAGVQNKASMRIHMKMRCCRFISELVRFPSLSIQRDTCRLATSAASSFAGETVITALETNPVSRFDT